MDKNDEKFYTKGAEVFFRAKHYAYYRAKETLERYFYNFFEGRDNFDDLDFEEVKDYLETVMYEFDAFEKVEELYVKFEEISKVE